MLNAEAHESAAYEAKERLDAQQIQAKCKRLMQKAHHIEQRWQDVRAARRGDLDLVFPDLVSQDWPKPIVANFIDTVARDLAEMVAPLPTFSCSSSTMTSDAARKFADKRTKIANHYVVNSKLDVSMQWGADHYFSYGLCVFYIEPDYQTKTPRIVIEEPLGGYPEFDRWGRVRTYTRRTLGDVELLANQFPEYEDEIRQAAKDKGGSGCTEVELIRYLSDDQITLVMMAKSPLTLVDIPNKLGEVPIAIAHRPWLDPREPKGQFDDVLWMQLARDHLAKLQLEASEKAVQAPLALPSDVQEISTGPDAVLRTASPEKIRRVPLDINPGVFTESAFLLEEMRTGTRYPQARSGQMEGSIVTGRGVQALSAGFDSQIKAAQSAFRVALTDVIKLCFQMDEKYWPNSVKNVRGQMSGTPYEIDYKPSKDIKNNHWCDVSYGFASGLDPNRAVVMLLQLRAEKAFSRDFFQRQLPFDYDVTAETQKVDVEETREAIKQGIFAFVQAIPAMAQSGQDPAEAVQKLAVITDGLKKGKAIEDVVRDAFAPQLASPSPNQPQPPGGPPGAGPDGGSMGGMAGGNGVGGGLTDSGLMRGVSPGQAGQAPGGRPDLSVMLAGLSGSGQPQMSNFVMKRRRI